MLREQNGAGTAEELNGEFSTPRESQIEVPKEDRAKLFSKLALIDTRLDRHEPLKALLPRPPRQIPDESEKMRGNYYGSYPIPIETTRLVLQRLNEPAKTPEALEQKRRPLREFSEQFSDVDLPQLIERISIIDRLSQGFRRELRNIQCRHYPILSSSKKRKDNRLFEHKPDQPYDEALPCAIYLAAIYRGLQLIREQFPPLKELSGKPLYLARKLDNLLTHPLLKTVKENEAFCKASYYYQNPYTYVPEEQLKEIKDYSFQEVQKVAEEAHRSLRRGATLYEAAKPQINSMVEAYGQIWDRGEKGAAPLGWLRDFGHMIARRTLAPLDLLARQAYSLRSGDGVFAENGAPGTIVLKDFLPADIENSQRGDGAGEDSTVTRFSIEVDPAVEERRSLLLSSVPGTSQSTIFNSIGKALIAHRAGMVVPAKQGTRLGLSHNIHILSPTPKQLHSGEGYWGTAIKELALASNRENSPETTYLLDGAITGTDLPDLCGAGKVVVRDLIRSGATVCFGTAISEVAESVGEELGIARMKLSPTDKTVGEGDTYNRNERTISEITDGSLKVGDGLDILRSNKLQKIGSLKDRALIRLNKILGIERDIKPSEACYTDPYDRDRGGYLRHNPEIRQVLLLSFASRYPQENFAYERTHRDLLQDLIGESLYPFRDDNATPLNLLRGLGLSHVENVYGAGYYPDNSPEYREVVENRARDIEQLQELGIDKLRELSNTIKQWGWIPFPGTAQYEQIAARGEEENLKEIARISEEIQEGFVQQLPSSLPILSKLLEDLRGSKERYDELLALQKEDDEKDPERGAEIWSSRISFAYRLFDYPISGFLKDLDQKLGVAISAIEKDLSKGTLVDQPHVLEAEGVVPIILDNPEILDSLDYYEHHPIPSVPLKDAEPISFSLQDGTTCTAVLGPNSSGKTVLLGALTVELISVLNGYPSSGKITCTFAKDVYIYLGAKPEGRASYSITMLKEMINAISNPQTWEGGDTHFLLLDEMQGFHPLERAAVHQALIESSKKYGHTTIFNTHDRYGLKDAAKEIGFTTWKSDVEVDEVRATMTPQYSFSPDPDITSESLGVLLAKKWLSPEQYLEALEERERIIQLYSL